VKKLFHAFLITVDISKCITRITIRREFPLNKSLDVKKRKRHLIRDWYIIYYRANNE